MKKIFLLIFLSIFIYGNEEIKKIVDKNTEGHFVRKEELYVILTKLLKDEKTKHFLEKKIKEETKIKKLKKGFSLKKPFEIFKGFEKDYKNVNRLYIAQAKCEYLLSNIVEVKENSLKREIFYSCGDFYFNNKEYEYSTNLYLKSYQMEGNFEQLGNLKILEKLKRNYGILNMKEKVDFIDGILKK